MTIRGGGHSGFFINGSDPAPANIVLDQSFVGPYPGRSDAFDTDVTIGDSTNSGVTNSTLCPPKQISLAPLGIWVPTTPSTGGPQARGPIMRNNVFVGSGPASPPAEPPGVNPAPGASGQAIPAEASPAQGSPAQASPAQAQPMQATSGRPRAYPVGRGISRIIRWASMTSMKR